MSDDKVAEAIDIVARRAVVNLIERELGDLWGDEYPEIGENDWLAVEERMERIVDMLKPDPELYEAAYAFLESRAEDDPDVV